MECNHCKVEIENDDNFCWNCGHWTTHGYLFLKKDPKNVEMLNDNTVKQHDRMGTLFTLMMLGFVMFFAMTIIQGKDMFRPIFYLKKQILSYKYGYNVSLMKTDNVYNKTSINNIKDAYEIIEKDIEGQNWQCSNNIEVYLLEKEIEDNYNVKSVNLCDISLGEAKKIQNVIDKVYILFPNIKGYLTNITITNAPTASEYVAYFQSINQFVNSSEDITKYNKVNKTQILLNSYYFLNENKLKTAINDDVDDHNWYVKDATWESIIAHEFGHYIIFVALLKSNNIDNIVLVTPDNYESINKILEISNNGTFADEILNTAFTSYTVKYNTTISLEEFSSNISKYASSKTKTGNILSEETIAEAFHDYYLHQGNASKSSLEIIQVLKEILQ